MIKPLFGINELLDSQVKLAIIRAFLKHNGLKANGREIAKIAGFSAPSTHDALKDLHACNILNLDIIGKQHIYTLNEENRAVQKILRPLFELEGNVKEDIADFLIDALTRTKIKSLIVSVILYGSLQRNEATTKSDVDVALVVKNASDVPIVTDVFTQSIARDFKQYFGSQLDVYIKSRSEFKERLKKNLPPVSSLIKSYSVLYGKEPLEI